MNEIKDAEIITEDSITEEIVDNNVTLAEEASSLNDIVELTNEQQSEMNLMELIKKDLYPTINNEEYVTDCIESKWFSTIQIGPCISYYRR